MPTHKSFECKGREYFYSPEHHQIFASSDIPTSVSQSASDRSNVAHIRTLYLNLSQGCNLNCAYCFNPPPGANSAKMDKEVVRGAIMKLAQWWGSKPTQSPASITFFGGEPLLNREMLEYAVHFSREWGREFGVPFSYSVSTNATLLNQTDTEFFNRENIFLWVSIDGPAEVHNRHRRFRDNTGSHDVAMRNALRALEVMGQDRVGVRATVSRNTQDLSKIINYFAQQGFRRLATKPVDSNLKEQVSLQENDLATLLRNMDECSDAVLRWHAEKLTCFPFEQDIESLFSGNPVCGGFVCAAGSGSLAVDTRGDVYPCHRFIGNQAYHMGNVRGDVDLSSCDEFAALDVLKLEQCKDCWARKFCLGCCPGASVAAGNKPGQPNSQTCAERKIYATISLKCAVAAGYPVRSTTGA